MRDVNDRSKWYSNVKCEFVKELESVGTTSFGLQGPAVKGDA